MWSSTLLDAAGRPSFNALQNFTSPATPIVYYVFDVLVLDGRDVTAELLVKRRTLLNDRVLPRLAEPVRESLVFEASLAELVAAVRAQGLEGLVDSRLHRGRSSGDCSAAWTLMCARS